MPIVAVDLESDPVASNYVTSLALPGSNLTGLFLDLRDMSGKLLQFLQEARPGLSRVGIVWDAAIAGAQFLATERAARAAGVHKRSAPVKSDATCAPRSCWASSRPARSCCAPGA